MGLLTQEKTVDRLASDPLLTTPESRALARVALANYFAGAVLMPYARFLEAPGPSATTCSCWATASAPASSRPATA